MPLSPKQRMQKFRANLKRQGLISFRVMLPPAVHANLKHRAGVKGITLQAHASKILTRAAKVSPGG